MSDNKNKKSVLGRGLSALIADAAEDTPKDTALINEIPLSEIEVNPFQPRHHFDEEALAELAGSIKSQGIITPITVRKLSDNQYQIISGERRVRASKMAGFTSIPAYIRHADDQQMLAMGIIENIQREDLNPIEIALGYQRLITECNLKQDDLGEIVSKNRTTVSNYLRLLKLPPDIQVAVRDNKISFGHARALIGMEKVDQQLAVYKRIINEALSVRKVEEIVKEMGVKLPKTASNTSKPYNNEFKKIQDRLTNHFGTRVALKADDKNQGEIKIAFYSVQDLNRILEILSII
ncbi:MAG: ParB/RepB/Spo0J family partition protein [Cytophagales bacterium]|nr:ParB/RepB/Spo0J family partition protein [Cytophagales bacterium]